MNLAHSIQTKENGNKLIEKISLNNLRQTIINTNLQQETMQSKKELNVLESTLQKIKKFKLATDMIPQKILIKIPSTVYQPIACIHER